MLKMIIAFCLHKTGLEPRVRFGSRSRFIFQHDLTSCGFDCSVSGFIALTLTTRFRAEVLLLVAAEAFRSHVFQILVSPFIEKSQESKNPYTPVMTPEPGLVLNPKPINLTPPIHTPTITPEPGLKYVE